MLRFDMAALQVISLDSGPLQGALDGSGELISSPVAGFSPARTCATKRAERLRICGEPLNGRGRTRQYSQNYLLKRAAEHDPRQRGSAP